MNKRRGISLIVLVITILVMIILAGVVIVSLQKNNPIERSKEARFKANVIAYLDELNMTLLGEEYASGLKVINKTGNLKEFIPSFKKEDEGKFEINNNKLYYVGQDENEIKYAIDLGILPLKPSQPNTENIFTPIKWENGKEINTTKEDKTWYNYEQKQWANAKTKDGSYYVWIPRFAYRIIYYANEADLNEAKTMSKEDIRREEKAIGFSDIRGIVNKNGVEDTTFARRYCLFDVELLNSKGYSYLENNDYKYDVRETKGKNNPRGLVIHPAFSPFRRNNLKYVEGNFGETKEIDGFWMAKFEIDASNRSVPGVVSKTNINSNDIFNDSRKIVNTKELESYNMTMTKWGAVVYLTQSQNTEIARNDAYLTGGTDYKVNVNQSSTGNITGIYDLNGCRWEYFSSFVDNGHSNIELEAKALLDNKNTRYVDVYRVGNDDTEGGNFQANSKKYGDSLYEVTTKMNGIFENNIGSANRIPSDELPIFSNGSASYNDGLFNFRSIHKDTGKTYGGTSFRVVIVEK